MWLYGVFTCAFALWELFVDFYGEVEYGKTIFDHCSLYELSPASLRCYRSLPPPRRKLPCSQNMSVGKCAVFSRAEFLKLNVVVVIIS